MNGTRWAAWKNWCRYGRWVGSDLGIAMCVFLPWAFMRPLAMHTVGEFTFMKQQSPYSLSEALAMAHPLQKIAFYLATFIDTLWLVPAKFVGQHVVGPLMGILGAVLFLGLGFFGGFIRKTFFQGSSYDWALVSTLNWSPAFVWSSLGISLLLAMVFSGGSLTAQLVFPSLTVGSLTLLPTIAISMATLIWFGPLAVACGIALVIAIAHPLSQGKPTDKAPAPSFGKLQWTYGLKGAVDALTLTPQWKIKLNQRFKAESHDMQEAWFNQGYSSSKPPSASQGKKRGLLTQYALMRDQFRFAKKFSRFKAGDEVNMEKCFEQRTHRFKFASDEYR